jgi:hypothetical protein
MMLDVRLLELHPPVSVVKFKRTEKYRDFWPTGLSLARRSLLMGCVEEAKRTERCQTPISEPTSVLGAQYVTDSVVRMLVVRRLEQRAMRRFFTRHHSGGGFR